MKISTNYKKTNGFPRYEGNVSFDDGDGFPTAYTFYGLTESGINRKVERVAKRERCKRGAD